MSLPQHLLCNYSFECIEEFVLIIFCISCSSRSAKRASFQAAGADALANGAGLWHDRIRIESASGCSSGTALADPLEVYLRQYSGVMDRPELIAVFEMCECHDCLGQVSE